jgi:hypothetical protein
MVEHSTASNARSAARRLTNEKRSGRPEPSRSLISFIGSARLNGLDPVLYLGQVMTRIAQHSINRIEELLPWHIKTDTVAT